jgi:hypothetical protein
MRRLTVNFPDAVFSRLESARHGEDLTLTQTLVRAVNLYAMMRDIVRNGGKVLIETDGGRTREVTFL